ncbi:MAG: hypothetical protein ACTSXH_10430 [Promethearchaeota archaeon]
MINSNIAINVNHLTKRFGTLIAVNDLKFDNLMYLGSFINPCTSLMI